MRSVHRFQLAFTLIGTLVLSGCFDDSGGSAGDDTLAGRLNFNGVSGLGYQTASQSGTTTDSGEFRYYPGETVEFRVGDLSLAQGVPAGQYVTFLEFFPDVRTALQAPLVDSEGLSTHTLREQQLLQNVPLNNLSRLLIALNWTENIGEGEGIEIRERVIRQLNEALPGLSSPIDFNVSEAEFTAEGSNVSPANQLLAQICFYPEDDPLCQPPPTLEEIDNAPSRPLDENAIDPDVVYSEDLAALRTRILESVRTVTEIDNETVKTYLSRELKAITTAVANRYYLDEEVASIPAGNTAIQSVAIRKIGGDLALAELEAISTRPQDVQIHATDWQGGEVEYFVAGPAGGESELLLSFRPEDTYRWVRKQLRVLIR
ncbi:MAG: organic solvent ABC transporter permease [Pseudomonadota bacterium]|nr:organic solvent ABC transporter permease [Pseudomonadota bacterium]